MYQNIVARGDAEGDTMATTIATMMDLQNHCATVSGLSVGESNALAELLRSRDDAPAWGTDWAPFFAGFSEREWNALLERAFESKEDAAMKTFQIVSDAGVDMGTYEAGTAAEALDAMARDAGYNDQAHAAREVGAFRGTVEEVRP